jgi:bifunctional DNase/RNase
MSVGGDSLTGVAQLAQGLPTGAAGGRPLSLDLLWQVLERGQQVSRRTWGVLRVAVVELRGNTFVGRVFFGDAATGAVAWDCDSRPSDACWLALKVRRRRRWGRACEPQRCSP